MTASFGSGPDERGSGALDDDTCSMMFTNLPVRNLDDGGEEESDTLRSERCEKKTAHGPRYPGKVRDTQDW